MQSVDVDHEVGKTSAAAKSEWRLPDATKLSVAVPGSADDVCKSSVFPGPQAKNPDHISEWANAKDPGC